MIPAPSTMTRIFFSSGYFDKNGGLDAGAALRQPVILFWRRGEAGSNNPNAAAYKQLL
jgi:hypothetical protein